MITGTIPNPSEAKAERKQYVAAVAKCPTCDAPMDGHPQCEACSILTGQGHWNRLCDYRSHKICDHCLVAWQRAERQIGREISWRKFLSPREQSGASVVGETALSTDKP